MNNEDARKTTIDWQFWISIPILIVLPFITPYHAVATNILIIGLFATGFNILLGYTGQLSFRACFFLGTRSYGNRPPDCKAQCAPLWAAMTGGVLAATLVAWSSVNLGFSGEVMSIFPC